MKIISSPETDLHKKLLIQPFFSVVITTYNRANLLTKALDSMMAQTENDWELIIIDDESTDNTYIKVLPYLRSKRALRYFRKTHSGEAMSKNTGINLSNGKFVTFLDSDDEYNPVHLQSRKEILTLNPAVRFLYGGVKIIGNQFVPDRFDYNKMINLNDCAIGGTFFIERSDLVRLNGFRQILLGTDADLFERAKKAGILMKETKIPTYIYHHENEDSITNMLIKRNSEQLITYSDNDSK